MHAFSKGSVDRIFCCSVVVSDEKNSEPCGDRAGFRKLKLRCLVISGLQ